MRTFIFVAASAAMLTGCGDPLAGVDRLSDVPLAEGAPSRDAISAEAAGGDRGGGFLAGLFGGSAGEAPTASDTGSAADETVVGTAGGDTLGTQNAQTPERRGFLARLFSPEGGEASAHADGGTETAALEPGAAAPASPPQRGRGSRAITAARAEDKAQDVSQGAVMPFASVGRVCDVSRRSMGKRIARSDAGYDLHDTAPTSVHPRTFYITGFSDGCPRQFTAALAMFGAPSMHEQLRYGRPSDEYPYSDTDKAYEQVKSAVCRVGRRKPCGSRIGTLERNTVFISTYERFTGNGRWADILIHDSAVLAASLKDP